MLKSVMYKISNHQVNDQSFTTRLSGQIQNTIHPALVIVGVMYAKGNPQAVFCFVSGSGEVGACGIARARFMSFRPRSY